MLILFIFLIKNWKFLSNPNPLILFAKKTIQVRYNLNQIFPYKSNPLIQTNLTKDIRKNMKLIIHQSLHFNDQHRIQNNTFF